MFNDFNDLMIQQIFFCRLIVGQVDRREDPQRHRRLERHHVQLLHRRDGQTQVCDLLTLRQIVPSKLMHWCPDDLFRIVCQS